MLFLRLFFFSFLILANGKIHIAGEGADYADMFGRILTQAGIRLQEAAAKRPMRIKGMNDSLQATAEAARGMASRRGASEIFQLLEEARRHYGANSFSVLLMAVIKSAAGETEEADRLFETFLLESRVYTDFEKAFLHWDEFHRLRRIVYEILRSRGVHFEGREEQIHVKIPFEALMEYLRDPSPEDRFLNIFFILIIILGTLFLFGAALTGADFSGLWPRSLVSLYIAVWVCYGLWFLDLAVGLPFGWDRFRAIPTVLGGVAVLRLAQAAVWFRQHRSRPLQEGYRRCPHCKAVIEKLLVECPYCRRKMKDL